MKQLCCILILLLFFVIVPHALVCRAAPPPFKSNKLSLTECVDIAIANNPQLSKARAVLEEKESLYYSALKDLYPSISMQYQYLRRFDSPTAFIPVRENYFSYSFTVEQPVYTGGALTTTLDVRSLDRQIADLGLLQSLHSLILDVNKAFYALLKAEKLENEAEQSVLRLQSHLKDARAFFDAGLIPKNDLLESEVQLAQGRQDQLAAQNRTALARSALNILMKQTVDAPLEINDPQSYEPYTVTWKEVRDATLDNRPELKQQELSVDIARKNITLTKSPYLPSLSIGATYQRQGDDLFARNYALGSPEVRTAQAVATWNIWNWGKNNDEAAAAQRRVKQSSADLAALKDQILLQVRDAFLNLERTQKNIDVTLKAVEQAEENYRINEARYQAQLNTSTEVLDAQFLLSRAKTNYFNAIYDNEVAKATLDWASGIIAAE